MSNQNCVPVIGLVGGVGSGKSTVARWLAERRNFVVIDGDEAGHRVLEFPNVKALIRNEFGGSVFNEQNKVIRSALGGLVFGTTPRHRSARARLEAIVHPEIRKIIENQITNVRETGAAEAILLDAAVLFEARWNDLCQLVVFVDAPEEIRLQRVQQGRSWNSNALRDREASQLPLEAKRRSADEILVNAGSVQEAGKKLEALIDRLIRDANNLQ